MEPSFLKGPVLCDHAQIFGEAEKGFCVVLAWKRVMPKSYLLWIDIYLEVIKTNYHCSQ